MNFLENDLIQGIENITTVSNLLKIPFKTILTSKAIFHYVYPKLYKTETLTDVSFISIFISSKINETHIKIEALIASINSLKTCTLNKTSFIKCESKIIEKINFNFEIKHLHLLVMKINKLMYSDSKNIKFSVLDNIYDNAFVNNINFFGDGKYEPELVALAYYDDNELKCIERNLSIAIDRTLITEIQNLFYHKPKES